MVDVVLYDSKLTTIKIGDAITTVTTASSAYDQITDRVTGGVTKWFKDVTVSAVDRPVELINFLGQDSNSLPNQALENKPFTLLTISGKLNYSPVDTDESIIGTLTGVTGTTIGTGKRYQFGALVDCAIGVQFQDGTKYIELAMNNARITKVSNITQSAGSHAEIEFEAVCTVGNFYEWVDDGV